MMNMKFIDTIASIFTDNWPGTNQRCNGDQRQSCQNLGFHSPEFRNIVNVSRFFLAKVDQNKYFNAMFGLVHSLFHFGPPLKIGKNGIEPILSPFSP
jgi:hypothetical protein